MNSWLTYAQLQGILSHRHDENAINIGAKIEQMVKSTRWQSEITMQQTREASRDSRAMKLVAFVSLLYLPGSYLAVSPASFQDFISMPKIPMQSVFGSNFFAADFGSSKSMTTNAPSGTGHIRMTNDVWLYISLCIPLTGLTFLCAYLWLRSQRKKEEWLEAELASTDDRSTNTRVD
jgi:hypothetical protein